MQRVIALEGGRNFRDLGGYATRDNRRVRWGRLYRSGAMSYLTPDDHAALRSRGIRILCDFRTRREREREVVDWDGEGRVRLEWDYLDTHCAGGHVRALPPAPHPARRTLRRSV